MKIKSILVGVGFSLYVTQALSVEPIPLKDNINVEKAKIEEKIALRQTNQLVEKLDLLTKPEVVDKLATLAKSYHDRLRSKGMSEAQANEIVKGMSNLFIESALIED